MLTQGQRNDSGHPGEGTACWPLSETKWISTSSLVKPKGPTFNCLKSFYEKGGKCGGRYLDKLGLFLDNGFHSVSNFGRLRAITVGVNTFRREETSSVCGIICGVLHSYKNCSGLTSWHSACNPTQRKKRRVQIQ